MSFTVEQVHAALCVLREQVEAGTIFRIESGICSNVRNLLMQIAPYDQLQEAIIYLRWLWETWPEYSGDLFFPVPYAGHDPESTYNLRRVPKWTGEYGAARLRLLDFLIEQTKPQP